MIMHRFYVSLYGVCIFTFLILYNYNLLILIDGNYQMTVQGR